MGNVLPIAPIQDIISLSELWAKPHTLDLAMAPEQDSKQVPEAFNLHALSSPLPPPQDYSAVVGVAVDPTGKPGARRPMYGPYPPDQRLTQWMVPPHAQYRAVSYSAFSTDYASQTASAHAPSSMADWSQYPLFPYACW